MSHFGTVFVSVLSNYDFLNGDRSKSARIQSLRNSSISLATEMQKSVDQHDMYHHSLNDVYLRNGNFILQVFHYVSLSYIAQLLSKEYLLFYM